MPEDLKGKGRAIDLDVLDDIVDPGPYATTSKRPYLAGLNEAQLEAVTWSQNGGLQILAGPGSGTAETQPVFFAISVVLAGLTLHISYCLLQARLGY